ncbi:MAG: CRISPR-associated endonuclease Cas1 [Nitrospirae bacterium]|nr:CRISPR-associated endonuclease Cas1 [Nitrospirota bacterium]
MIHQSLLDKFLSKDNFLKAYRRISLKNSVGGIDKVSVEDFGRRLDTNIHKLIEQLKSGHYTPHPVSTIHIPKFNEENEWRELGLPTVADKVVQAALLQVVEPLAEKIFLDTSYGYRPGKGHYKAIRRIEHNLRYEHKKWAGHRDIDNFFDSLDHNLLLKQFSDIVKGDSLLIELAALWCRMGLVEKNGKWKNVEAGVRQGHIISPLLANLYLHSLDKFVSMMSIKWVRYADDYLIQGNSKEEIEDADTKIIDFLKSELLLGVNNNANPINSIEEGFVFLGIHFCGEKRFISQQKMDKIQRKIHWVFSDGNKKSLETVIRHVTEMSAGWRRYYGFLNPIDQFSKIQHELESSFIVFTAKKIKHGLWESKLPENIPFPLTITDNNQHACFKKMKELWHEALKANNTFKIDGIKKVADKKISGRRRKYRREQLQNTDLVITTPGCFIGKRGERIIVRKNQQITTEMPAIRLTGLTVGARGVSLSGDVIELCMGKDIYIHFVDELGKIIAIIAPPTGNSGEISLLQATERSTGRGLHLAKMFVLGKVKNQFALLKYYHKYRIDRENGFGTCFREKQIQMERLIREIKNLASFITPETFRQQVMGLEGAFALHYWAVVKKLFHNGVTFDGRIREGAKDIVNASLNYGYGILYSRVLNALIKSGLNPVSGFLHGFQHAKPVLVYDLIEEFRAEVVDRSIFTLFRRGEKLFQSDDGMLTPESRKKIARAVIRRLSSETYYAGRKFVLEDVIREQAVNIKKHLNGMCDYRPYLSRW